MDIELRRHNVKIKHYHADGGAELISKQVLNLLRREGARYTWNPADTPELNSTSERKFRTLGERCLSMLLRSGLPVDFWWDAYQASNYITVRLPTKNAMGYMTPWECVHGEPPNLAHLRIWGCKAYLKMPKNYARKDWREKVFSGYFIGYSDEGEVGYRLYIPDFKEVLVGVNVTFNEVVPSYEEEYFNELKKLSFEVAPDESTVDSFDHLVGAHYFDDDTDLEFVTTRIAVHNSLIVAYRAPVLLNGRTGREEKSPIHVADVIRMRELSLRLSKSGGDRPAERKARGGLTGATSDGVERFVEDDRVKFNLREDVRVRVSDDPSEGEEEGEVEDRSLPRDVRTSQKNHNMPNRVLTRQAVPLHEQTLSRSGNLLLSH